MLTIDEYINAKKEDGSPERMVMFTTNMNDIKKPKS